MLLEPTKLYQKKLDALQRLIYVDMQEFPSFLSYKGELIFRSKLPEIILQELEAVDIAMFEAQHTKDELTHVGEVYPFEQEPDYEDKNF